MAGPLTGVRVVEVASIAPAPFGCMILADLGAQVLRVDRPDDAEALVPPPGPLDRGRHRITLDLKRPAGVTALRAITAHADVFVEGFRPGVAERLGIGPDDLRAGHPRLIYARMTGWGQHGPLANTAGHDINYIALAGALEPLGRAGQRPHAPINLLGDFAGGGMLLTVGVLAALVERQRSGQGQVVDAAMVDGAGLLTAFLHGLRAAGLWPGERGTNLLDGGAPFYDTYRCADGRFVAVGCLEPRFYAELLARLGLDGEQDDLTEAQADPEAWPRLRERLAERFAQRTRDEWVEVFADSDACVTPVLSPWEAPTHPHHRARGSFVEVDGVRQPAPAPRFSRTLTTAPQPPGAADMNPAEALAAWGLPPQADLGEILPGIADGTST